MTRDQRDSFEHFARNERWGTCGSCPRTTDGKAFPEFCQHTSRFDHHLTLNELAFFYRTWKEASG